MFEELPIPYCVTCEHFRFDPAKYGHYMLDEASGWGRCDKHDVSVDFHYCCEDWKPRIAGEFAKILERLAEMDRSIQKKLDEKEE